MGKQNFQLPALGVLNSFMMGDTVLCEAPAKALGFEQGSYVISNYPEFFLGHPTVHGVRSFEELPKNARIIDLGKAIISMEGKGKDKHVIPRKFEAMCKLAGLQRAADPPELYLTSSEVGTVQEMRSLFPDKPNVGVVLGSAHVAKNWTYMILGIKRLVKKGYNVFIFGDKLNRTSDWAMPDGVYEVIGKPIRQMMQWIAMMDVMMGPDTGPMHVAGALGIPLVVICFRVFSDLYAMYDPAIVLETNNFTLEQGIRGISVRKMASAVEEIVGKKKRGRFTFDIASSPIMSSTAHAYIRIKGIGDVGLSLPAIATARSQNGNSSHKYAYITGHAGAVLLRCTDMFDKVIEVDYEHAHSGFPLPPPGVDYSEWDTVENLINAIDFVPHSDSVERTELFARAIGLDKCDYTAPGWKLKAPQKWKEDAWDILGRHDIREGDKVLVFQVDTAGSSRIYPKARQIDVIGMAMKQGWKVVLVSDKIRTKYPKACANLTGQLSLEEYYGMVAIATVGLSPDSALIHIAGAMDVDAVGLFGPVDPALRISHYDTVHAIVGKDKYCITRGKFTACNDWQNRSCSHKNRTPLCMWNISAREVMDKITEVHKGKEISNVVDC